ncbi:hypothetical protein FA95DRAFT_648024 [Auriscalpium vulgare]|uniref:Uncharacterized protein n=1 Tax=Auriscalpium vulgare TaxID=40419 RepID=A0ACB8RCN5_9AGAM|nr:hypothetical protein FA95DRAFT_648024 [Auriscalpium vulgare]
MACSLSVDQMLRARVPRLVLRSHHPRPAIARLHGPHNCTLLAISASATQPISLAPPNSTPANCPAVPSRLISASLKQVLSTSFTLHIHCTIPASAISASRAYGSSLDASQLSCSAIAFPRPCLFSNLFPKPIPDADPAITAPHNAPRPPRHVPREQGRPAPPSTAAPLPGPQRVVRMPSTSATYQAVCVPCQRRRRSRHTHGARSLRRTLSRDIPPSQKVAPSLAS